MRSRRNPYSRRAVDSFRTETALCAVFLETARAEGLVAHPETSGWDVLVVDPETGEQAGVEAKLRPNVDVLYQAIGRGREAYRVPGPAVHAVLVPSASEAFSIVADALRVRVVEGWRLAPHEVMRAHVRGRRGVDGYAVTPPETLRDCLFDRAPRWEHVAPAWVPEVEVTELAAGVPGPRSVTPWKIAAVKFCLQLRARGSVRRADVEAAGMSWAIWPERWLEPIGREGRVTIYGPRIGALLPDELYPGIAAALAAAA